MNWTEAAKLLDVGKVVRASHGPLWVFKAVVDSVRPVSHEPIRVALGVYVFVRHDAIRLMDIAILPTDGEIPSFDWVQVDWDTIPFPIPFERVCRM